MWWGSLFDFVMTILFWIFILLKNMCSMWWGSLFDLFMTIFFKRFFFFEKYSFRCGEALCLTCLYMFLIFFFRCALVSLFVAVCLFCTSLCSNDWLLLYLSYVMATFSVMCMPACTSGWGKIYLKVCSQMSINWYKVSKIIFYKFMLYSDYMCVRYM